VPSTTIRPPSGPAPGRGHDKSAVGHDRGGCSMTIDELAGVDERASSEPNAQRRPGAGRSGSLRTLDAAFSSHDGWPVEPLPLRPPDSVSAAGEAEVAEPDVVERPRMASASAGIASSPSPKNSRASLNRHREPSLMCNGRRG